MKTIVSTLLLVSVVLSASALDKADLDNRIRTLTGKFDSLQQQSDKAIPAETLRKAQGIILLDRTKAGFIFAYQGGGGVALVREPKSGTWSPAAFLSASEASLGFQIGGEQNFFVILLMTTNVAKHLGESTFDFGGEARGTAGNSSDGVEGKVTPTEPSVLIYDDRHGLFGGAAVKGGVVSSDDKANQIYYGRAVTPREILFDKKVKPSETTAELATKLTASAKK